jgi:hypothetical protein
MITKEQLNPTILFAAFYRCSVEHAVCSETEDENTIEYGRLSEYVRTQIHAEEVQKKQGVQTQ